MRSTTLPGAGLLLLRGVVGVTFLLHGLDKLAHPSAAEAYFASLGIPEPGLMGPFVGTTETVGGLLLIAGLATRVAGLALASDMLVAFLTVHVGLGFFVEDGGAELVFVLGGACAALVVAGAGEISLDAALQPYRRVSSLAQHRHAVVTRSSIDATRARGAT
jgi:putative oxidoreductase